MRRRSGVPRDEAVAHGADGHIAGEDEYHCSGAAPEAQHSSKTLIDVEILVKPTSSGW